MGSSWTELEYTKMQREVWELFAGNYRAETRNDSMMVGRFFFLPFYWLIIILVRSVRGQVAAYLLIAIICLMLS